MNLSELRSELNLVVRDSSLLPYFDTWINEALQSLAMQYDFPSLKRLEPYTFPVQDATWHLPAPEIFQKGIFRCYDSAGNKVRVLDRMEDLEKRDWEHIEVADHITHICAFEQGDLPEFAYYPKATESVKVWFYNKPAWLDDDDKIPSFIPSEFHFQLVIPEIIIKNFERLQDMVTDAPHNSLGYWIRRKQAGLTGSSVTGEVGFLSWIVKSRGGPRRHGGRDPLP